VEDVTKTEEPTGDDKPVTIRLGDLKGLIAQVIDEAKAQVRAEVDTALEAKADEVKALYGVQSNVQSQLEESNQATRQSGYKAFDESAEAMGRKAVPNTLVGQDPNGPLYGNRDFNQQFNLRDLTPLKELPSDKVIVVLPKYNKDSAGTPIGFDLKNCTVQYFDVEVHKINNSTDKMTGSTVYQMLQVEPIVVHDPS
jgi:hypothetical protein